MVTLKKVVYTMGKFAEEENRYLTIKDICEHMEYEDCDLSTLINRVRSQMHGSRYLFGIKRLGGRNYWRLNKNGINYYNKIKDFFDPITDTMLVQPLNIEVLR